MGTKGAFIRNLVIIIIFIKTSSLSYSQTELRTILLGKYEINDSSLMKEIDKFLLSEKVCSYYSDSLKFSISICDWNGNINDSCRDSDTLSVTISSIIRDDLFYFNAVGFFIYNGFIFSIENVVSRKFFNPTHKAQKFTYYYINTILLDDDSITYWTFKYFEGKFFIENERYNCPSKRK